MTAAQKQLLQSRLSDLTQPGTIVADFQAMLDFVGTEGLPVANKQRLFPMKEVTRLNDRLANPLHLHLERPQLRSYPNVAGLYLILRASGLGVIRGSGEKACLKIDPDLLDRWSRLTPLERYLNLFAIWTLRSSGEMVGDKDRATLDNLQYTWGYRATVCYQTPGEASLTGCFARDKLVFAMFGMMEIESGESKPGKGWWPKRVHQTDFGQAMMAMFMETVRANDMALLFMACKLERSGDPVDYLRQQWAKLFPAWKQLLVESHKPQVTKGTWLLKVSLGGAWRRLAVPCDATLANLASIICQAYSFDFDHTYEFSYRDAAGSMIRVSDEFQPEGLPADEVILGEVALQPGQEMLFRYDPCDNWEFRVEAQELYPKKRRNIELVEEHGEAPRQYPEADE